MKAQRDNPSVCVIGEGMLELREADGGWGLGYGGDTINSAVHMARAGVSVAYGTALGDDALSDDLRASWRAEGVDDAAILTVPGRLPGLYAIHVDASGERSFSYWRSESAARAMFDAPDIARLIDRASGADLLYYSLITLAILPETAREQLFELCRQVRAGGGRVAFDSNYRPRLWPDFATAQAAHDRAISCCDIGLPTLEDEVALGAPADPAATAARWRTAGVSEVIVKLGVEGCLVDGAIVPPPATVRVVDTSGAGDAFNAGYLAARLAGVAPARAAVSGHRLAGWTIGQRGAIPARTADAPYAGLTSA